MISFRFIGSLLAGRNSVPLEVYEITRVSNTFQGIDSNVNARYQKGTTTSFIKSINEDGQEVGEIVFSEDIYPGQNITNPNAALSLRGAVAHELAHYHRWQAKAELPHGVMTHIDEAMTSLEAALRYSHSLDATDIQGLISDSLHRIGLFIADEIKGRP